MWRLVLFSLLFAGIAPAQLEKSIAEFFEKEERLGALRAEVARLNTEAHAQLDKGAYEVAVETHRTSRAKAAAADALERKLTQQVGAVSSNLIDQLDADRFVERESASLGLTALGVRALPFIQPRLKDPEPERRVRLKAVLEQMGTISLDAKGRLVQWAVEAKASTEYSSPSWAAAQATGPPNTPVAGDYRTAWAPKGTQIGKQWLELRYRHAMLLQEVGVVETYNPGAVVKLEALDETGNFQVLWEGKDPTRAAPATFVLKIPVEKQIRTKVIRLTLDTNAVNGYNEIDAVLIKGPVSP